MTKCHRISFELSSSSKIWKEEYETCTRWIYYIQVSFGFLTWTYEYAFSFLSESSWLPLEALPRWLGRAYTALCSLDDEVTDLSVSFLESIVSSFPSKKWYRVSSGNCSVWPMFSILQNEHPPSSFIWYNWNKGSYGSCCCSVESTFSTRSVPLVALS